MKKGFTLVEIMIVIAIIVLLAAMVTPGIMKQMKTDNESAAQTALRTISTAFEKYAADHSSQYPTDVAAQLVNVNPPYLKQNYFTKCTPTSPCSGYAYSVSGTLAVTGYIITARPTNCITSATKSFSLTTGGVITTDATCTPAS